MMRRLTQSRARVFLLVVLVIGFVAALALVAGAALQPASKSDGARGALSDSRLTAQSKPGALPAESTSAGYAAGAPAPNTGSDAAARNASTAVGGGAAQPAVAAQSNINVPDPNAQRQIIKTGTLSLVVKDEDIDAGMAQIRAIAAQYKGDVLNANVTKSGDLRLADVVIQVPSDQFESAMEQLRTMPSVKDRRVDKTTSQDVSEEYVDVKAQVDNLKATEARLLDVMAKATRTEDILAVQREITNVRGQIDRLQGRLNYLDRRSAMSTINLHLEPPGAVTAASGWRFSEVLARAWERSLRAFQGVATVLITVAAFAVWLLPLLGLGWLAWAVYRRRTRAVPPTVPPAAPPAAPPAGAEGVAPSA